MIDIVVSLTTATICFLGQCHPVLVGPDTPTGVFPLQHVKVSSPGYGGDALAFAQDSKGDTYAIHRVWLMNPKQKRAERLASPLVAYRTTITMGCVNLQPAVYNALVDCCSRGHKVRIVR